MANNVVDVVPGGLLKGLSSSLGTSRAGPGVLVMWRSLCHSCHRQSQQGGDAHVM